MALWRITCGWFDDFRELNLDWAGPRAFSSLPFDDTGEYHNQK